VKKKMADKAEALRKEEAKLAKWEVEVDSLRDDIRAVSRQISEQAGDEKFRQDLKGEREALERQQQELKVQIAKSELKIAELRRDDVPTNTFESIRLHCMSNVTEIPSIVSIDGLLLSDIPPLPVAPQVFNRIISKLSLQNTPMDERCTSYEFLTMSKTKYMGEFDDAIDAIAYLDVAKRIINNNEDDVHGVYERFVRTPLECFVNDTRIIRNSTELFGSITTTVAKSRPDLACYMKNLLIFRGEEKKHGEPLPLNELREKMVNWNPATLGRLPYVFGYAAAGATFQLVVLYPQTAGKYNLDVQLRCVGRQLNLLFIRDCIELVRYMINLSCILNRLAEEIPSRVPNLGLAFQRDSARNSVVIINNDHVHKKLISSPDHRYIWTGPGGLAELYDLAARNEIQNTIKLAVFPPGSALRSVVVDADAIDLRLAPIGYREEPRDFVELRQMLSDVLIALKTMHNHSWVHRDLKMANIIRCIDGSWMLIDLDLACKMDSLWGAPWPFWSRPGYPIPVRKQEHWMAKQDIEQLAICVATLPLPNKIALQTITNVLATATTADVALNGIFELTY